MSSGGGEVIRPIVPSSNPPGARAFFSFSINDKVSLIRSLRKVHLCCFSCNNLSCTAWGKESLNIHRMRIKKVFKMKCVYLFLLMCKEEMATIKTFTVYISGAIKEFERPYAEKNYKLNFGYMNFFFLFVAFFNCEQCQMKIELWHILLMFT